MTSNFSKTVRLGTVKIGRWVSVYCKIKLEDGKLSISGVEGPTPSGNAVGGCGQINMRMNARYVAGMRPAPGWSRSSIRRFLAIWGRWHLNDMKAGSAAQEEWLRANPIDKAEYAYPKSRYEVASAKLAAACLNPDADGYRYGTAWKREEVPAEVVEWLRSLPDTDKTPAWV